MYLLAALLDSSMEKIRKQRRIFRRAVEGKGRRRWRTENPANEKERWREPRNAIKDGLAGISYLESGGSWRRASEWRLSGSRLVRGQCVKAEPLQT